MIREGRCAKWIRLTTISESCSWRESVFCRIRQISSSIFEKTQLVGIIVRVPLAEWIFITPEVKICLANSNLIFNKPYEALICWVFVKFDSTAPYSARKVTSNNLCHQEGTSVIIIWLWSFSCRTYSCGWSTESFPFATKSKPKAQTFISLFFPTIIYNLPWAARQSFIAVCIWFTSSLAEDNVRKVAYKEQN